MPLRPEDKVLLDVCCGRWGWSKEFAKRGWRCVGIDLLEHEVPPENCKLVRMNLLALTVEHLRRWGIRFAVASTPCEEFARWGMRHFNPNPPQPELGIKLFQHFEWLCKEINIPYVQENVRAAQQFVEPATCNAGAFHLWHNFGDFPLMFGTPFRLPQGLVKGFGDQSTKHYHKNLEWRRKRASNAATIPPELAACVADYAERILEQRQKEPRA